MKQITTHNRAFRLSAVLGAAALCACMIPGTAASADDHDRIRRDRAEMRYDVESIRRDQAHLRDLQRRRDEARRDHNWRAVHRLDDAIANTQWRIDNRRYDAGHDFDRFYSNRDRDWFFHRR